MKYKTDKHGIKFLPENLKDAYMLGTTFNESSNNDYSVTYIRGELESVSIKFLDILSMVRGSKNE